MREKKSKWTKRWYISGLLKLALGIVLFGLLVSKCNAQITINKIVILENLAGKTIEVEELGSFTIKKAVTIATFGDVVDGYFEVLLPTGGTDLIRHYYKPNSFKLYWIGGNGKQSWQQQFLVAALNSNTGPDKPFIGIKKIINLNAVAGDKFLVGGIGEIQVLDSRQVTNSVSYLEVADYALTFKILSTGQELTVRVSYFPQTGKVNWIEHSSEEENALIQTFLVALLNPSKRG